MFFLGFTYFSFLHVFFQSHKFQFRHSTDVSLFSEEATGGGCGAEVGPLEPAGGLSTS